MRANRRMARLHKSADFINENPDMSEKEKAASINKLMAKAESGGKGKKSETKLVVARGANRGLKGRPKGVKGRYKMVDPRMKKVRLKHEILWEAHHHDLPHPADVHSPPHHANRKCGRPRESPSGTQGSASSHKRVLTLFFLLVMLAHVCATWKHRPV